MGNWITENCTAPIREQSENHKSKRFTNEYSEASSDRRITDAILAQTDLEALRGIEGQNSALYFSRFNELILNQKEDFHYDGRSRRPPMDRVNALLSFVYTLLGNDCAAALEAVGLDAYVGFLHRDRPGRISLALDLMEKMRAVMADRFVLTLINTKAIRREHFTRQESGAVLLSDTGRKTVLSA